MNETVMGVIGGSGLYDFDTLENAEWIELTTPWGKPSDAILSGSIKGMQFFFLPRHGRGHVHTPSSVPYRANIDALKQLGVTDIISLSACGSFREDMAPGHFVIIDQFIDRTTDRDKSFFGPGCVGHVSMAYPVCQRLTGSYVKGVRQVGVRYHETGTYLAMEGPQFSTLAESRLYRDVWGCDVIGMTNMPEARLAREAEICYATVAMVTDYDCWHPDHGEIDIPQLLATLKRNTTKARELLTSLPDIIPSKREPCPHGCDRVLDLAIITPPDARSKAMLNKLRNVAGRIHGTTA